ncbi:MAG: hypothetical protein QOH49_2504 [Acidobacteriota bacterium]|jgi:hypothetical protein|nr:hypothetical protein [Acidobacteriota bacterium]
MRGRTDFKAGYKVGGLNNTLDLAGTVRKLVSMPGVYSATSYVGRDKQEHEVFHVELKGQALVIGGVQDAAVQPPLVLQSAVAPQMENAAPPAAPAVGPSQMVNEITNTVDAVGRLAERMKPAGPSLTLEEVDRRLDEKFERFAEKLRPAPTAAPPKTATDTVNEIVSIVGAVDRLRGDKTPPPAPPQKNPGETFLEQLDMFTSISERLGPQPEGGGGFLNKIGSAAEGIGRGFEKLAPSIPQIVRGLTMGAQLLRPQSEPAGPPAQQPGTQPQQPAAEAPQSPQAQPQPEQQLLASAGRALAKEVTRDNIEKGADIVESLTKSDPFLAMQLQELFSMPSVSLVEWLAGVSGCPWLPDLPHGVTYFDVLKQELTERESNREASDEDEQGEAAPVPASTNGHKPNGAAVTQ